MEPVDTPRTFSGRYELTHLIARGGMAQVYRAHDRLLDRPVALKVLFPELSIDRTFVERFRREAQAAANLSHPNIVQVFDWGEDGGTYFIVMELVDGHPLSALLRSSGTLPPHRAADIGAHVAAALSYAHRHGVVHRDVKPGNVLITDDGQVKVTDFGIARAVNTEESLTQTGAVMGTAAYFSPEQAEGIGVDGRSDIYSLGVVLFEMVTGRAPFLGDSPVAVASKHVRDLPPLPRELNPLVPAALESVIMKAMAKSPDQRYQTADDLRADLLRFADGRPVIADDPVATSMMTAAGATQAVAMPNPTAAVPAVTRNGPNGAGAAEGEDNPSKRLLIILGVLVVVLLIVAFFLLRSLGYLGGSSGLTVPDLVGKTSAQATAALQADGLTVGSTSTKTSSKSANTVLATDPTAGTSIKKGAAVKLVLSSGPTVAAVPNIVGQSLNDALTLLQSAGFNNYTRVLENSTEPGGTVLKVDPGVGTKVSTSTRLKLTVSNQNSVTVPSVAGLSTAAAGAALSKANLTVGSTSNQCSNSQSSGLVIATSPAAGATATPNETVNLVVSTGTCSLVLQDTTGQPQAQATSTLQGQSTSQITITVSAASTNNCPAGSNGNVVSQNPGGGTQVTSSTTVTLTICANTTTTTAPTTTTTAPTTTTVPATTTTP